MSDDPEDFFYRLFLVVVTVMLIIGIGSVILAVTG